VPDGKSVKIVQLPDGTTTLVLEKAKPEDAGEYEVTAANDKGSVSSKARLDVTGSKERLLFFSFSCRIIQM